MKIIIIIIILCVNVQSGGHEVSSIVGVTDRDAVLGGPSTSIKATS